MARPTKYTEDIVKRICDALAEGCTRRAAYGSVGIDQTTFLAWIERYSDFSNSVTLAEAEAEAKFTKSLWKSATGYNSDWRAAESWLKRRRREEWGDNVQSAMPDLSEFDDAELDRIAAGEPIERVLASSRRRRAGKTAQGAGESVQPAPPPPLA